MEATIQPTELKFINTGESTVVTYWMNADGKEIKYSELHPGCFSIQNTFVGHIWIVKS